LRASYSNPTSKILVVIQGEQGELITDKEDIMKRWKDSFFLKFAEYPTTN
jgi:hypothetical protein